MNWTVALIPLLIVLATVWPYLTRVLSSLSVRRRAQEPSASEELRPKLASVDIEDLMPPSNVHASEPWDKYWRLQHETGLWTQ
jgi:hypothetical protein